MTQRVSTCGIRAATIALAVALTLGLQGIRVEAQTSDGVRLRASNAEGENPFESMYRRFFTTYRIGPDDHVAIYVKDQPDYTLQDAKVSPVGRVFHPLLGDVEIVGLTVTQATDKLALEFREYIRNPLVTVSLLEAKSAKVGVIGEVRNPGILIMSRPMTILEAISESGGFTDFGSKSSVVVLRPGPDGQLHPTAVNVKRILEGKAKPDENIALVAGDTIIVNGNKKKAWSNILAASGLSGFTNFVRFGTGAP